MLAELMDSTNDSLGRIYNMKEAATRLGISRRALQDLVRQHPFYALNGNRKLFTERDLVRLFEAMRARVPKPLAPLLEPSRSPEVISRALVLLTNKRRRRQ